MIKDLVAEGSHLLESWPKMVFRVMGNRLQPASKPSFWSYPLHRNEADQTVARRGTIAIRGAAFKKPPKKKPND